MFGVNPFTGCTKLTKIYYRGTAEEWAQIPHDVPAGLNFATITEKNPQFYGVTIYFYSETAPTEPGNYWRYVDGVPTPWETQET